MYQVEWLESALNQLADAWINADSSLRQAITKANSDIDRRLSLDPLNEGESRTSGRRIMFAPPISTTCQIEADGVTVTILQVRVFRSRRG